MFAHIDYSVSENCKNPDSYGVICVKCGKCGRKFKICTYAAGAIGGKTWKMQESSC